MVGLLDGLKRNEVRLLYQPEFATDASTIVGVECLVRWKGAGESLSTEDYVRAAEESGGIDRFGAWAMRRACQDAAKWGDVVLAVNVSPVQLRDPAFSPMVIEAARAAGLRLDRLELEITEGVKISDLGLTAGVLRDLRAAGVKIALDDFGTGHSSLAYLRALPVDRLKIDRSFVTGLPDTPSAQIVRAIIGLAKSLSLDVVAEGVETDAQLDFLREAGCDCFQGFLLSGPLEPAELDLRLQGRR